MFWRHHLVFFSHSNMERCKLAKEQMTVLRVRRELSFLEYNVVGLVHWKHVALGRELRKRRVFVLWWTWLSSLGGGMMWAFWRFECVRDKGANDCQGQVEGALKELVGFVGASNVGGDVQSPLVALSLRGWEMGSGQTSSPLSRIFLRALLTASQTLRC